MKSLFAFLFLLPLLVFAQKKTYTMADMPFQIDSTTGGYVYQGVVVVPNATADQLYSRAKTFFFKNFVDAKSVIQVDDKASGIIAGKGLISPNLKGLAGMMGAGMNYETPIEIRVKDGRYRYELSNLYVIVNGARYSFDKIAFSGQRKPNGTFELMEKQYNKSIESLRPFSDLVEQLKATMSKPDPKDF